MGVEGFHPPNKNSGRNMTNNSEKIISLLSSMYLCKPRKGAIENWKILFAEDVPDFMPGLKDSINGIDSDSEEQLSDLLWEYTRLFIGPYKLPCPPWESVYTSGKRLMMQEAYDEVRNLYNEVGLKIDQPNIMPDHIGAELNFLGVLYSKISDDHKKRPYYKDIAKRFLDEHLKRWIPQFTLDMEEAANLKFYKALAKVTRDFIIAVLAK
jgi:TorA maturation chaperone TorD